MGKKIKVLLIVLTLLIIVGMYFLINKNKYDTEQDVELDSEYNYSGNYFRGDVNGNSKLDSQDYKFVVRYLLGKMTLNDSQKYAADANDDGRISAIDYKTIVRKILSGDTSPPGGSSKYSYCCEKWDATDYKWTTSSENGKCDEGYFNNPYMTSKASCKVSSVPVKSSSPVTSGGGLQYFGYYGPGINGYDSGGLGYKAYLDFQKQINSNVIVLIGFCDAILDDIKNDPVLKTRKVYVHAGEIFWAKDSAAYIAMYSFIERNKYRIDGIMVDEPYWNWKLSGYSSTHQYEKNNVISKSKEFREKYPNMKLIGIMAYVELDLYNSKLQELQQYYQNFTDVGFDYYDTWSNKYSDYLNKLGQVANYGQDLWIVNYSFAYSESAALSENDYIDVLQGQYNLAKSNSRVVGILAFNLYDADGLKGFRWLVENKRYTNFLNKHKEIADLIN